jgi:hypothetical protein
MLTAEYEYWGGVQAHELVLLPKEWDNAPATLDEALESSQLYLPDTRLVRNWLKKVADKAKSNGAEQVEFMGATFSFEDMYQVLFKQ